MNSIQKKWYLMALLSVPVFTHPPLAANELTTSEIHHVVTCPDPADAPCIMKRPFNAMDYTVLTKDIGITEGNGVWIVSLAKSKASKKQTVRVMDFFGQLHTIDVTVEAVAKSEKAAQPTRTNSKAAAQPDKKKPTDTDAGAKPISLEKFISK